MTLDLQNNRDIWLTLPDDITWEGFCVVLEDIRKANQKIQWLIGDALLFCEGRWKDRIEDAKARTGLASSTLNNYLVVSRAFPTTRRRVSLSWNHHLEALRANPDDRDSALKRAEQNGWSKHDLRLALSDHCGEETEKGGKIGFLPLEWAIQIKRWIASQPPIAEWETDNIAALKARFDNDIIPIYAALVKEIDGRL